jgi:hypothetical protein
MRERPLSGRCIEPALLPVKRCDRRSVVVERGNRKPQAVLVRVRLTVKRRFLRGF